MNRAARSPKTTRRGRLVAGATACGLLMALPSCRIPDLRPADAPAPLPATFNGVTSPDNSARLRIDEFFNDPVLTDLIRCALAGNQELKILAEDVRIAGYEVQARRGALFPFVTARAGAGLDRSSRFTREGAVDDALEIRPGKRIPNPLPNFLVATEFTWQIDIWRKLRNARDAAALRYLASNDGRNYVVTRLVAQIAENYYSLLALDQRLVILDQTIALQEQSLRQAEALKAAGRGTELGVQRFQAEVRKNQSEKLIVRQEIVEAENRINFLAGRFPQPVERAASNYVDLALHPLDVGVPSQLLLNRPDVREAERELEAAGLEVKVARAEFFPSLVITGGVGYEAYIPRFLFNPEALAANIAGGLVAPLVNRTAVQTAFGAANARQLQAVYNYQRVVLDAVTEVVNRVSMAENYRQSIDLKKQQLGSLEASVGAAGKLFQNARAEYIEVLTAQRDLLEARTVLVETKRQQLVAFVNAYQALGGGGAELPLFDPDPVHLGRYKFFRKLLAGLGYPGPAAEPAPPPEVVVVPAPSAPPPVPLDRPQPLPPLPATRGANEPAAGAGRNKPPGR